MEFVMLEVSKECQNMSLLNEIYEPTACETGRVNPKGLILSSRS